MSVFRSRKNKPNQLELLRRLEEESESGKVLMVRDGMAIVEGLKNDAPIGTELAFVSGASGVLLWRRSDNICIVLLLSGAKDVAAGHRVATKIKAILQVVDDVDGPMTKREFELFQVPVGETLLGQVCNFVGQSKSSQGVPIQLGVGAQLPLFNQGPNMEARTPINEALLTGIKAVDALTPLGRGQALMVNGPRRSGKTSLGLDCILAQRLQGVRCVYAAINKSQEEVEACVEVLRTGGALPYTTVVVAQQGCSLGERYAAACYACSIGEYARDSGRPALVVHDDLSCMPEMWNTILASLVDLGPDVLDVSDKEKEEVKNLDTMVDYEGTLLSATAAQRRKFFASLIQRGARLLGKGSRPGGSLTLVPILPGMPATGEPGARPAQVAAYQHLSRQQKEKLLAALERSSQQAAVRQAPKGCVSTEIVEEFMSITDGQVVLQPPIRNASAAGDAASSRIPLETNIDPRASISRIGSRAHPPALATLAPELRFNLAQAVDAQRFGMVSSNEVLVREQLQARLVKAALAQAPHSPVPLGEQVAILYALQKGFFRNSKPEDIQGELAEALCFLRRMHPTALANITATQSMSEPIEAAMAGVLEVLGRMPTSPVAPVNS
ncbi:hypothetical protein WJX84_004451 [Apatococcus fuscideae]